MSKLRVGTVPYAVARPLDGGLEGREGIELTRAVPAELVEGLRAGALDVALVSSVELFRRPGYRYLAGPGTGPGASPVASPVIGTRGRVSSVQLFLRRPLRELRTIAMDPASRTSAALVRGLLSSDEDEGPTFLEVTGDPRDAEADGWLRIGDRALAEALAPDAPPAFNPSEEWCRRTGLPFAFALWIARDGVDLGPWKAAFADSLERGCERLESIAESSATALGLPLEALRDYFLEECLFRLPPAELRRSLRAFRDLLAPHGLARADLDPEPVALGGDGGVRVP